jgi:hypothetical protein
VAAMLASVTDHRRILISGGGGTPPGVSAENLRALSAGVRA